MKSHAKINRVAMKRVFRVIAVFFLIYTGLDLTVPGVCSEESSVPGIVEVSASANPALSILSACIGPQTDLRQDQSPRTSLTDDDCFCCCTHVLPGNALAAIAAQQLKSAVSDPVSNSLLSPPLQSPFHPPRNI
jgi:hypothetical protein